MSYTVKELAKLSNVSVRTLHYYDEIGLLKPAYHGENGYRFYEETELLRLQQILFFRELDFELHQIKEILGHSDFSQIAALASHRSVLIKQGKRIKRLINTIDKTIDHLKGVKKMSNQEMYQGFTKEKQAEYEQYLIKRWGEQGKKFIAESKEKVKDWKKADYENLKKEDDELYKQFAQAIDEKLKPKSPAVQILVEKHYQMTKRFYLPTKESYIGLGHLYLEHPDFRKFFEPYHPNLTEFIADALKIYAEENL